MLNEELEKIKLRYSNYNFEKLDSNELVNSKEFYLCINDLTDLFIKEFGLFLEKYINKEVK